MKHREKVQQTEKQMDINRWQTIPHIFSRTRLREQASLKDARYSLLSLATYGNGMVHGNLLLREMTNSSPET
jgi:hypothetical protein